jgi:uncharacterized protein (TIGR00255 family)
MSVASMTGFARQEASGPFGTLVCELRSVNHRFLDLSLRLPDSCRALEPELRQVLAGELRRGKVDCTISHRAPSGAQAQLTLDKDVVRQLLALCGEVVNQMPALTARLNVLDVLRWPGVLAEDPSLGELLGTALRQLFAGAVADLQRARRREGERLAVIITERCTALAALVGQTARRVPEIQQRARTRLQERLAELGGELNHERIEQEVVLLLQRLDVAEELDRLGGHLSEAQRLLTAPEAAGRRLDFLLQEFNREANTLSSKSQDLETTRCAVEMKVLIEQMREQVQNIE